MVLDVIIALIKTMNIEKMMKKNASFVVLLHMEADVITAQQKNIGMVVEQTNVYGAAQHQMEVDVITAQIKIMKTKFFFMLLLVSLFCGSIGAQKITTDKHNKSEKICTNKASTAGGISPTSFSMPSFAPFESLFKNTPEFHHHATIANDNSDSLCFFVLPAREGT